MGYKIGVDFGTTNTTVAFVNHPSGVPEGFRYQGPTGYEYIPSCVAYANDRTFSVGRKALHMAARPDITFCNNFKMILPLPADERAKYAWARVKSPETVVKDYLLHLLKNDEDSFSTQKESEIEGIVLSIPHVWDKSIIHPGRSSLQRIITDAGLPLIQLISEPVAAAAYYAYRFQQEKKGRSFQGNLLVCDMGGGTFDVTLCKITPGKVEELHNDGSGRGGLGEAGVFFDRKLILNKDPGITENSAEFYRLYNALQEHKTVYHSDITKRIDIALADPDQHEIPIMVEVGGSHTYCYADVSEAFKEVRESIGTVLKKFKAALDKKYAVDAVFFVGGFSQFRLVIDAIKTFWGLDQSEPHLIGRASRETAAYAIAYGAALIANDMVTVEEKYEHTIGVVAHHYALRSDLGVKEEKQSLVPIIKGDRKLSAYETVKFAENKMGITGKDPDIYIYVHESSRNRPVIRKLPETLDIIKFSKTNRSNSLDEFTWKGKVGMRINRSKVVYLVLMNENGECVEYELGDLLRQMFGGLQILEEE